MKVVLYAFLLGIVSFLGLVGVAMIQAGDDEMASVGWFLFMTAAICAVLCVVSIKSDAKKTKQDKRKAANDARLMREGKIPYLVVQVKHIAGLNLAQHAECKLSVWKDRIVISDAANRITVYADKIRSAGVTDKEYTVYINKGNAGKAFFGSILAGAAVGIAMGGPQSIAQTMHERALCVQYAGNDGTDGVLLFETDKMRDLASKINEIACAGVKEQVL